MNPSVPKAAQAQTAEGAVAFTTYFTTQVNTAFTTRDPQSVAKLSTSQCKTCSAIVGQIQEYLAKGQTYDGEFFHITSNTVATFSGTSAKTFIRTDSRGAKIRDSGGTVVRTVPAQSGSGTISLNYTGGQWRVTAVQEAG